MEELRDKRTRNSKTYQLDSGKYRLELGGPHRHCKIDGQWVNTDIKAVAPPLNDTLNAHGGGYTHYYPKALTPIELDQNTGASRMIFEGGASICLGGEAGLNGEFTGGVTPTVSKSTPDYDVKYIVKSTGLKRWWRLKKASPGNITTLTSPIKCIGCSVVGNKVISDKGKELAKFSDAFCYEESSPWNPFTSDGEHKPVSVEATSTDITVNVDTNGMKFPIIVDPTLTVSNASADSWIRSDATNRNNGGFDYLVIRSGGGITMRFLIRFDFSALPPNKNIDSSTMSVYLFDDYGLSGSGRTYDAKRLTQAWVEGAGLNATTGPGVTWDDYDRGSAWPGGAGGDGDTTETGKAQAVSPADPNWMDWDVKTLTEYFYANESSIMNVLVRDNDEAPPVLHYNEFYSSENASANKPKLVIEYSDIIITTEGPISAPISGPISAPI
jgi:hypothetical protein